MKPEKEKRLDERKQDLLAKAAEIRKGQARIDELWEPGEMEDLEAYFQSKPTTAAQVSAQMKQAMATLDADLQKVKADRERMILENDGKEATIAKLKTAWARFDLQNLDPPRMLTPTTSGGEMASFSMRNMGDNRQRTYKFGAGNLLLEVYDTKVDQGGTVSTLLPITPDLQQEFSEWQAERDDQQVKVKPPEFIFYSSPWDPVERSKNDAQDKIPTADEVQDLFRLYAEKNRRNRPAAITEGMLDVIMDRLQMLEAEVRQLRSRAILAPAPAAQQNLPNRGIKLE